VLIILDTSHLKNRSLYFHRTPLKPYKKISRILKHDNLKVNNMYIGTHLKIQISDFKKLHYRRRIKKK